MFRCNQSPAQFITAHNVEPRITTDLVEKVGDILLPWKELGNGLSLDAFEVKGLFVVGLMWTYYCAANAVLKELRHEGFAPACSLLFTGIELLGRCIHPVQAVRQHPSTASDQRLREGLKFLRRPSQNLGPDEVVATNHHRYVVTDLCQLRNFVTHGSCIARSGKVIADIELLHELRKLFIGILTDERDPSVDGPAQGAIDRYFEELLNGDPELCSRLADAAITPRPTELQEGDWPLHRQIVSGSLARIQQNMHEGLPLKLLGRWPKSEDHFQLYTG